MRLSCSLLVVLAGCARGESDGPSTVALTQVDVSVQTASSTALRRTEVSYQGGGGPIADIALTANGSSAGRLEAGYDDGLLARFDVIDVDGDRGQMTFRYDDRDRLAAIELVAPSVYTVVEEYAYGEDGVAHQVMTRVTQAGEAPATSYVQLEYDDDRRLIRVSQPADQVSSAYEYDDAGRLARVSMHTGSELTGVHIYAYDDGGRVAGITSLGSERWEVTYDDGGYIGEIRHLGGAGGETTVYTYGYGAGGVDGIRFAPDLPDASLFDLRGRSFPTIDFLSLAPAALSAQVPSPPSGGPVCGNDLCESGENTVTCPSDCVPAPVCGNGLCESPSETTSTCPSDCGGGGGSSCFGLCGSYADTCYCDDACAANGDCCPDYQQECGGGTSDSCVGLCGSYAETCYCDDYCTANGDCCPDYNSACGA